MVCCPPPRRPPRGCSGFQYVCGWTLVGNFSYLDEVWLPAAQDAAKVDVVLLFEVETPQRAWWWPLTWQGWRDAWVCHRLRRHVRSRQERDGRAVALAPLAPLSVDEVRDHLPGSWRASRTSEEIRQEASEIHRRTGGRVGDVHRELDRLASKSKHGSQR